MGGCASASWTRRPSWASPLLYRRAARRESCRERGAIRQVFDGKNGGRRDAILLNAAGAIAASGHAADLREGLEVTPGIDSGAAEERLELLIAFSRENVAA